ncbi:hypothetical protein NBRC10512_008057 [Rhodotorula toruloides]|uniref:RHTO0S05e06502g1_1 n=2 Tax=Rhodotorula toruloides TaxID=5286 RepID=A0A061AZ81_RHOTO|nr:Chromo domain containing protein [Rhodotorula toruloides NP11]EMS23864.1 Chromo domain containing protein [Rhodotorula toruloides NP11]CDR40710.1 RHTO0S05e06502g1_1 [Rhodotorula toruloides]
MPRSPEPQLVRRLEMPAGGANDAPSSDSESEDGAAKGEEVYEVEAIRASRFDATTSAMRYLVKWKGYSEDEKTWEPIENLENCLDLVTEYNKRKEEREARRASITPGVSLQDALNKNIRLPGASADESSDQGLSMKELDARRAKAKKKQSRASTTSTSAGRVEDAVADKWERKATGKDQKTKSASTEASPVASTSKASVQQPPKKKKASKSDTTAEKPKSSQKKRRVEDAKATPPPAKKPKKARPVVASESSDSDDHAATVRRTKQPTPLTAATSSTKEGTAPAAPPSTAAKPTPSPPTAATPDAAPAPTASTSAQRLPPEPTPQPQQTQTNKQEPLKTALAPIIDDAASQARTADPVFQGPWAGALGKLLSKSFRKSPPPPPPLAEQLAAVNGRVRFSEDPVRLAQVSAAPRHSTATQPHSALRQTSLQPSPIEPNGATPPQPLGSVSPNLRSQQVPAATDPRRRPQGSPAPVAAQVNGYDSRAASPVEAKPQVQVAQPQAAAEDVAAREKKVKDRATQLQNLENRLRRSPWFQSRPEFVTEDLTVACTMAIPIDPHLVMRLKAKGVAVLVSHGRDETVSGEGLALAYLLMRMCATTPSNMQEVEAVCIHRKEPLVALEALYCELVNLDRHFVEFFYFGGDEPATPVFTHGYHVLPTLAALQQGAAFDRFCQFSRDPVSGHCVVAVHPATVAMARKEVNWPRIHDSLSGHQIDVIGREMIKLDSAFATVEKSELLERAVTFRPLPHVTSESEFAEIINHSVHVRANYPTVWRRFIVVVSESVEEQVQKARTCGVEVHTWSSLAELVTANPFG